MKGTLAGPATVERSEGDAITRAQRGDREAFESLYKAHSKRVYSVCLRMIRNPAEAEDLTQQVFLQLFRKIGTFRGESGFSTWLHRVTVNVVLMHLRRKRLKEIPIEDPNRPGSDHEEVREQCRSDSSMFSAIERLNLKRAISKLPPGYKRQFLLSDLLGYEHSEVAKHLGCSIGCSKSQLHKARKRLQRLLQGETGRAKPKVCPA
jgi:RNA polymerase sigma-70 factor (ECF subfamily)